MSDQKIPDKNNFLEKFAAIEGYLNGGSGKDNRTIDKKDNNSTASSSGEGKNDSQSITTQTKMPPVFELKCPNCGAVRETEEIYCSNCGHHYETISDSHSSTSSSQDILKCSNCNTPYNLGDEFCMNCGNKL